MNVDSDRDWRSRRDAIGRVLAAHQSLWRSKPFCEPEPAWLNAHPDLAGRLLALEDETTRRLARGDSDGTDLLALLSESLPDLGQLVPLISFPARTVYADRLAVLAAESVFVTDGATNQPTRMPSDWRVLWEVPGRKSAQIAAFAHALDPSDSPVLEWCAGKGHLGRLLARHGVPQVTSLEIESSLCVEGERLAQRLGLPQHFRQADALADDALSDFAGHHAVALHACGDLHRALVRGARAAALDAIDVAPCCYQRTADDDYQLLAGPLPGDVLTLSRDDLRLAVTGAATAAAAEVAAVETETAWKLAFQHAQSSVTGQVYRPTPSLSRSALRGGFRTYVESLAAQAGIRLGGGTDWRALEAFGWRRQREVARLTLLRYGFRRAIEAFVVCDLAACLEQQGYAVSVGRFCAASLTPRNLLISARRRM